MNLDGVLGRSVPGNLAAEKAGWGSPLPPRHGRGVSCQISFASFIATVAHVEVDEHGQVRLHRLTTAVDTGIAVNPDTIVAQLQGGMIFGATAALWIRLGWSNP